MGWLDAPPLVPLLALVFGFLLAERALELAVNDRNTRWLRERGATWLGEDGFGLILAVQVLLFVLVPLEALASPWGGTGWWTWPLLGVALGAQALRYWCIRTLGARWNVRVVTLPGAPRIVKGPYRWLPHPNYVAVVAEVVALPLAFGAWASALLLVPLKLVALARRIRLEERALVAAASLGATPISARRGNTRPASIRSSSATTGGAGAPSAGAPSAGAGKATAPGAAGEAEGAADGAGGPARSA